MPCTCRSLKHAATMPELPAHASPELVGTLSLQAAAPSNVSPLDSDHDSDPEEQQQQQQQQQDPPGALISPAFTPPPTPGTGTPAAQRDSKPIPIDISERLTRAKLLDVLPHVNCLVRARIPTNSGQEMFLHLYQNDLDNKEHLAIVFGPHIRSSSLDAPRPGETEMDRMIRGAYTGRLFPGRASSGTDALAATSSSPRTPSSSSSSAPAPAPAPPPSAAPHDHAPRSAASTARQAALTGPARTTPLVRIHSECYTGETVWSARCDCGEQLDEAARLMSLPGCTDGVIIYLRQEGRGIGLGEKLKAYNLQDLGSDTVEANLLLRHPADARSYGLATAMLLDLGLGGERGIRLLTNNPDKIGAVEGPNQEVVVKERVAMIPLSWAKGKGTMSGERDTYLRTKIERMGHMLQM